ncbi:MAG: hypothetical protein RL682_1497 [Pseudomonadota bacterium]|jgi:hypothetical protein
MSYDLPLSKIDYPREIFSYFDWHRQQRIPLLLMSKCNDKPVSAMVVGIDGGDGALEVVCAGMGEVHHGGEVAYAAIGSTSGGANFLASGQMRAKPGTTDNFNLSFPQWIDVSQSRDSFRCSAQERHFLHFSSVDPHLNDIICRVENVSLGGLAVEWDDRCGDMPLLNNLTEAGILQWRDNKVHLGKLRVAHITPRAQNYLIGLNFEYVVPKDFGALVLDAQRAHYVASSNDSTR